MRFSSILSLFAVCLGIGACATSVGDVGGMGGFAGMSGGGGTAAGGHSGGATGTGASSGSGGKLYAVLLLIIFIGFIQDKLLKLLDKKLFKFKYA